MADQRTSELDLLTALQIADDDFVALVDKSDTTDHADGSDARTLISSLRAKLSAGRSTFSDANYTILATDRLVAQVGALTAGRTVTLPAANAVPPGWQVTIVDESITCSPLLPITIARAGSDTINALFTQVFLISTQRGYVLESDGVSNWTTTHDPADALLMGPWYRDNVAASLSAVVMAYAGMTTFSEVLAPRSGWLTAVAVHSSEARTAGSLTADVTINGTVTGVQAILNATNTTTKTSTQRVGVGSDPIAAGDRIGIKLTTSGTWAPTTADIVAMVEISV